MIMPVMPSVFWLDPDPPSVTVAMAWRDRRAKGPTDTNRTEREKRNIRTTTEPWRRGGGNHKAGQRLSKKTNVRYSCFEECPAWLGGRGYL